MISQRKLRLIKLAQQFCSGFVILRLLLTKSIKLQVHFNPLSVFDQFVKLDLKVLIFPEESNESS